MLRSYRQRHRVRSDAVVLADGARRQAQSRYKTARPELGVEIVSAAHPIQEPSTSLAGALTAALAEIAAQRPDLAAQLPWHAVTDPDAVAELHAADADSARLRAALTAGESPESLGLVDNAVEQVLRDRGLA